MSGEKREIAVGWAKRTWASGRAAASLGKVAARHAVERAVGEDSGDDLADRLDELKGLSMKVGQMLSYLDGAVPPRAQQALQRLQHRAKPMGWDAVDATIREAYGRPPDEIFDGFERGPFAAASIGQVHRAAIGDQRVAVKVQYPEIAKAIAVDLDNFGKLGAIASLGTAVASGPLIAELRERLREECDYRQEAANQALFRTMYAGWTDVVVPEVRLDLARERVLVTGLVGGIAFDEFVATASVEARNAAGLAIWRAIWTLLFRNGLFNGDPHPGNYRFQPDGRVALLDFGCVRAFDVSFLERWRAFAQVVRGRDRERFPEAFAALGFVGSSRFDFDAAWRFIEYLYEPMRGPGFRFDTAYAERAVSVFKWDPNLRKTAMPPEWLLLNRLQWGLFSLLGRLNAEGDFATPFWAAVDAPIVAIGRPDPIVA